MAKPMRPQAHSRPKLLEQITSKREIHLTEGEASQRQMSQTLCRLQRIKAKIRVRLSWTLPILRFETGRW
ncbi:hypothetical protein MGG_16536 [Pyricularia oryzae 70-15]|uniref:Uncharacterized protein n=1 Tax=Pyricularia oryzae (strain 70-15 / ATCC MYA-4617 / FGSC 8958) TaxID=242507 RepID=G4MKZ1_PYRO7|nr:uncharacterized protein MGG_16536 [Pyricularia oryzae 70-15]EHA58418.1 hypothetical protein MGG_16536 [Pyricularia oryzae 70-15]